MGKVTSTKKMEIYENILREPQTQQKEENKVKPATVPAEVQMRMPRKTEQDVKSISFTVI